MVDFMNVQQHDNDALRVARLALNENCVLLGGDDAEGDDREFHPERKSSTPNSSGTTSKASLNLVASNDSEGTIEVCGELEDMA